MIGAKPYVHRLSRRLEEITENLMALMDESGIGKHEPNPPGLVIVAPDYFWKELSSEGKRIQNALLKAYKEWYEHIDLLFRDSPGDIRNELDNVNKRMMKWIEQESNWSLSDSLEETKQTAMVDVSKYYELLDLVDTQHEPILIPDTNSLIHCPALRKYKDIAPEEQFSMFIPPTVLKELDELKIHHRNPDFRNKVQKVIKRLKGLRSQGSVIDGVTIHRTITVKMVAKEGSEPQILNHLEG